MKGAKSYCKVRPMTPATVPNEKDQPYEALHLPVKKYISRASNGTGIVEGNSTTGNIREQDVFRSL